MRINRVKYKEEGFSVVELVIIIAFLAAIGGITFYIVNKHDHKNTTSSTQSSSSKAQNGTVKPTISDSAMVADMTSYLKNYYVQNGQYPQQDDNNMDQLVWKYGYDFMDAGPDLSCPQDNGFLSFDSTANQQTSLIDSFDLYSCNGKQQTDTTQASISTYTASDAVNRVKDTYNTVLSYEQEDSGGTSQTEVDSVKANLAAELYNKLSSDEQAATSTTTDPILCSVDLPDQITASAGGTDNSVVTVPISETFKSSSISITATVNLSNLEVTSISCPSS